MNYYLYCLQQYAVFTGRARRKEYWMFVFISTLISIVLAILAWIVRMPYLANIYSVAVMIPSIAVGIRRMHDVGKSGWFGLIPIYNIILACTQGDEGENEYGEDPKQTEY